MLRNREGFTLIELLIVVVIIGILAAVAIPKFSATREKAYISAMKSDLRNLQTAQEVYYSDPSSSYNYGGLTDLQNDGYSASQGVTIAVTPNGGEGWHATATHSAMGDDFACAVYVGTPTDVPTEPSGLPEGVVGCTDETFGTGGGGTEP